MPPTVARAALRDILARSQAPLKARIMDQARLAGVGNLICDETLWRAGLDPARPAGSLTPAEVTRLHKHLRATFALLTERGGSHTGDLQAQRSRDGRCPRCHRLLDRRTVGGRTTYSCPHHHGFDLTRLIASWSAVTPGDSRIEVRVRGRDASGRTSSWDVLGRWAAGDRSFERRTVSGQGDDLADVNVDTWETGGLRSYQLRVTLLRHVGADYTPAVDAVGAMSSRLPAGAGATSKPGPAAGTTLDVPKFSQMVHSGHFPRWGGGGQAWCSPTSTSMVLAYYNTLPPARAYGWVGDHPQPWVDDAARMTYDYDYDGAGNWPFNTAYAAPLAGKALVTRLRSMREAERFIVAGIPLVASIAFGPGELDDAPISSTPGHLLVIVGFTRNGNVVVNDPAASSRSGVRRVYDRGQLERAWLKGPAGRRTSSATRPPLPGGQHSKW